MYKDPDIKSPALYRLPYQQCKLHYEKLNYICLSKSCHQHSLICSICKDGPEHQNHLIKPLKFYIEQLQKKYYSQQKQENTEKTDNETYEKMLDELEISRYTFYQKLQSSVQKVAEQFRKLQQDVINSIQKIKSEILNEISKRNQFSHFYDSLKRNDLSEANFLIQKYLPQASIGKLGNLNLLDTVSQDVCVKLKEIRDKIVFRDGLNEDKDEKKQQNSVAYQGGELNLSKILIKPANITYSDKILAQTLLNDKNLCLIDHPIHKLTGRIVLKIINTKSGSDVIFGIIQKPKFTAMFEKWKYDNTITSLGTKNVNYGWDTNQITMIGQGSKIQAMYKGGNFVMKLKNKQNKKKLEQNKQYFLFVVLFNEAKVKITHAYSI